MSLTSRLLILALLSAPLALVGLEKFIGPPAVDERVTLDAIRKEVAPAAAKMGMTVDEYLATGKAANDAIKRYGP